MSTFPAQQFGADTVVEEWIDPHLPSVFSRWHSQIAEQQRETIAAIISAAGVRPGDRVLDVGCGSGIPSLSLASAVGPSGHVMATDPSPVFIAAAEANAQRLGLHNVAFVQSSAAGQPFQPASFDAVTCHMAVMFFSDVEAGLRRIRELLRPGGRAAFVAWGDASRNQLFGTFWGAARPYLSPDAMAEPPPDAPHPMRFARSGSLSSALRSAGFAEVIEETRPVELIWPGTAESLRDFWFELTRLDEQVEEGDRASCRTDVLQAYKRFSLDGQPHLRAEIVLASGRA